MKSLFNYVQQLRNSKCTIIIDNYSTWGGGTSPIINYYKYSIKMDENVKMIVHEGRFGFIKVVLSFCFSKKVVLNGLDILKYFHMLFYALLKSNIIIYPHTVMTQFNLLFKNHNIKRWLLKKLMKKKLIACVSYYQKKVYSNVFNSQNLHVVYNNITIDNLSLDQSSVNIMMAGYFVEVKGVTFFSKLADHAKLNNEQWKFYWAGSGPPGGFYFSDNVTWLGELNYPRNVMTQCEVFFLSSYEDAFPLVCLEALSIGKKCVVYKDVGTAEVLSEVKGCGIYEKYDVNNAYSVLKKVIAEPLDKEKVSNIVQMLAPVEKFASRLDKLLEM